VKKASILHLILAILLLACTSAKQVLPANEGVYTLEQFGGQAWYLPADGRLQEGIQYPLINFTPAGADAGFLRSWLKRHKLHPDFAARQSTLFYR